MDDVQFNKRLITILDELIHHIGKSDEQAQAEGLLTKMHDLLMPEDLRQDQNLVASVVAGVLQVLAFSERDGAFAVFCRKHEVLMIAANDEYLSDPTTGAIEVRCPISACDERATATPGRFVYPQDVDYDTVRSKMLAARKG